MNAASPAAASHAPARAQHDAVPAHARQLAAQLSALFQRDVEIVEQLNDAHHRLRDANERIWSGLAPDAFGLLHDHTTLATTRTSPTGALTATRDALQQVHWMLCLHCTLILSCWSFSPDARLGIG
jgi:hypothetical protein